MGRTRRPGPLCEGALPSARTVAGAGLALEAHRHMLAAVILLHPPRLERHHPLVGAVGGLAIAA